MVSWTVQHCFLPRDCWSEAADCEEDGEEDGKVEKEENNPSRTKNPIKASDEATFPSADLYKLLNFSQNHLTCNTNSNLEGTDNGNCNEARFGKCHLRDHIRWRDGPSVPRIASWSSSLNFKLMQLKSRRSTPVSVSTIAFVFALLARLERHLNRYFLSIYCTRQQCRVIHWLLLGHSEPC